MATWEDVEEIALGLPEVETLVEAWLCRAPKRVAKAWLEEREA